MSDRERGESGQFIESVALDDVLTVFEQVDGPPVITSSDVADRLDCTGEAARQKLTRLFDRGEVGRRKTGRTTLWWPLEGDQNDEEAPAPAPDTVGVSSRGAEPVDAPTESTVSGDDERERAAERLRDLDRAGDGTDLDLRVEAVLTIYDHLRVHQGERLSKGDFKEELKGTDVGYGGGFDSLWSNWICKNSTKEIEVNALAELPGVERRGHEYVYTPGHE